MSAGGGGHGGGGLGAWAYAVIAVAVAATIIHLVPGQSSSRSPVYSGARPAVAIVTGPVQKHAAGSAPKGAVPCIANGQRGWCW